MANAKIDKKQVKKVKQSSAKKRMLQSEQRNERNVARKSEIKTLTKKVMAAVQSNDTTLATELLRQTESKIARARGKGVFKKNTASRKIGTLARRVAAASALPAGKVPA